MISGTGGKSRDVTRRRNINWFDAAVYEILHDCEEAGNLIMTATHMDKKPPSLPKHWPNPSVEDLQEKPKRIVNVGDDQAFSFCNNFVKTSKYEWWDFLPKFLMEVSNE
jgi:Phospholipid-translocating ATPase N-terminal